MNRSYAWTGQWLFEHRLMSEQWIVETDRAVSLAAVCRNHQNHRRQYIGGGLLSRCCMLKASIRFSGEGGIYGADMGGCLKKSLIQCKRCRNCIGKLYSMGLGGRVVVTGGYGSGSGKPSIRRESVFKPLKSRWSKLRSVQTAISSTQEKIPSIE